jgi:hypothetical protein
VPPLWAIALMGSAAWVWWRKRQGLPILPGKVPHVVVLTPSGPALVPATTQATPLDPNHPAGVALVQAAAASSALSLAQAYSIHVPRSLPMGGGMGADQGVMGAFDPFDPYTTAPSSLRVDEFGMLRSTISRPFYAR